MNRNDIQNLHIQAENLREQDKFTEAISAYNVVKDFYEKSCNFSGMIEAMGGQCLTYKHLYLSSGDVKYLTSAKNAALSALNTASRHKLNDNLYRIYFWLGEIEALSENNLEAIKHYKSALKSYPSETAEKGDFQYHLGAAQYKNGDKKTGKQNILAGIEKIISFKNKTDTFLYNVWLSGGYMTLAKLLWFEEPDEARIYLEKAEKIISSDARLIIRKHQLQELKDKLLKS